MNEENQPDQNDLIMTFYGDLTKVKNDHDNIQKSINEERNREFELKDKIQTLRVNIEEIRHKMMALEVKISESRLKKKLDSVEMNIRRNEVAEIQKKVTSIKNDVKLKNLKLLEEREKLLCYTKEVGKRLKNQKFAEEYKNELKSQHLLKKDELMQKKRDSENIRIRIRQAAKAIKQKEEEIQNIEDVEMTRLEKILLSKTLQWKDFKTQERESIISQKKKLEEKRKAHKKLLEKRSLLTKETSVLTDRLRFLGDELSTLKKKETALKSREELISQEIHKLNNRISHQRTEFTPASSMKNSFFNHKRKKVSNVDEGERNVGNRNYNGFKGGVEKDYSNKRRKVVYTDEY